MKPLLASIYSWLDERLGLTELLRFAQEKTVPVHRHTSWYYWGGLSLCFFAVQVVTGVLLMLYYRPGPDAYESVRQINFELDFGWLVRSVHAWSANLMIAAVFVHMFSVFFMRAYRQPRELGWWSGLGLLLMAMLFGFSGYLLPMNKLAFFATRVGLETAAVLPGLGPKLADLARGGLEVNEFTVQRFFTLHVVALPAVFLPLLGFHLWLVQKHGNALPPSEEAKPAAERKTAPFFPNFMMRDLAVWLIALTVLAVLAALFPWELGEAADPLEPAPKGIHPEWYFMSSFQVLKVLGTWFPGRAGEVLGMAIFGLGLALWLLIPLYDTRRASGRRARRATWLGLGALAALVITTIWGYLGLR